MTKLAAKRLKELTEKIPREWAGGHLEVYTISLNAWDLDLLWEMVDVYEKSKKARVRKGDSHGSN